MKQYFCLSYILALLVCCHAKTEKQASRQNEKLTDEIQVYLYSDSSNGFGYRISQWGKDLIDQPNIPAVSENKAFASRQDALQTALLVKQKMEKGVYPPAVTITELDSMHIRY